ncbi:hypothetical protein mO186R [Vaccinia virus]|uniref:Uncharacterized protein n=2 Tax=Vaccinia virus TaxID=10245 RepID=Q49PG8_VACC0|nr:hypothetical protein m8186R [Vaccinia virus]AAW23858.1 hypothetical protein mO186R [Vaccinia virus]
MILSLKRCISLSISALLSLLRLQSLNCLSISEILSLRRRISLCFGIGFIITSTVVQLSFKI